ncbi:MAG: YtxH domain-containing protein [Pseudoflavonifractor sp.]|nr:YtxH domain-containing protein [Pseudoflavonifractor sp.]
MSKNILYAFIGGALAGAGAALLFAPEKGVELRERIKAILKRRGLCCCDSEVDELVEQLTAEIED